jgi:hypothetical protein
MKLLIDKCNEYIEYTEYNEYNEYNDNNEVLGTPQILGF